MFIVSNAPSRVRTAIILLWISVLFTLMRTIVDKLFFSTNSAIVLVVSVLATYGIVVYKASRRRNWARYVLLVWAILGAVSYLLVNLVTFQLHSLPWWDNVLDVASFAIEFAGIYLLFTNVVSQWYRPNLADQKLTGPI